MKYCAYDLFPTKCMLLFFVLITYADFIKCPIKSKI